MGRPTATLLLLGLLAAASGALLGCGGGSGDTAAPPAASPQIERSQLPLMVLPLEAFGPEASALPVDLEDAGFATSQDAADATFDPDDTAQDIEAQGWVATYNLEGVDLSLIAESSGLASAGTSIDLLADELAAEQWLRSVKGDLEQYLGATLVPGVDLLDWREFDVGPLGDGSFAAEVELGLAYDGGQKTVRSTFVGFRLGRLVASAGVMRVDEQSAREQVATVTTKLLARVHAVLAGEVTDRALDLGSELERDPRATQSVALGDAGLRLQDLPDTFRALEDGPVEGSGAISEYGQEFKADRPAKFGRSRIDHVSTQLYQYTSEAEATLAHSFAETLVEDPTELIELIESELPAEARTGVRFSPAQRLSMKRIGDQATGIRLAARGPNGGYDYVFVFLRTDDRVAFLFVSGPKGRVKKKDVVRLSRKVAKRLAAAERTGDTSAGAA